MTWETSGVAAARDRWRPYKNKYSHVMECSPRRNLYCDDFLFKIKKWPKDFLLKGKAIGLRPGVQVFVIKREEEGPPIESITHTQAI